jgi:hypothetical protein
MFRCSSSSRSVTAHGLVTGRPITRLPRVPYLLRALNCTGPLLVRRELPQGTMRTSPDNNSSFKFKRWPIPIDRLTCSFLRNRIASGGFTFEGERREKKIEIENLNLAFPSARRNRRTSPIRQPLGSSVLPPPPERWIYHHLPPLCHTRTT